MNNNEAILQLNLMHDALLKSDTEQSMLYREALKMSIKSLSDDNRRIEQQKERSIRKPDTPIVWDPRD